MMLVRPWSSDDGGHIHKLLTSTWNTKEMHSSILFIYLFIVDIGMFCFAAACSNTVHLLHNEERKISVSFQYSEQTHLYISTRENQIQTTMKYVMCQSTIYYTNLKTMYHPLLIMR